MSTVEFQAPGVRRGIYISEDAHDCLKAIKTQERASMAVIASRAIEFYYQHHYGADADKSESDKPTVAA